MKKLLLVLFVFFFAYGFSVWAQNQLGIIDTVLKQSTEEKVTRMQELIGFDDAKAKKLNKLEFQFLLDVRKAERCFLCNKKKRIERLKQSRDASLQETLSRDEYIKYQSIENNLLNENNRLWLQ